MRMIRNEKQNQSIVITSRGVDAERKKTSQGSSEPETSLLVPPSGGSQCLPMPHPHNQDFRPKLMDMFNVETVEVGHERL